MKNSKKNLFCVHAALQIQDSASSDKRCGSPTVDRILPILEFFYQLITMQRRCPGQFSQAQYQSLRRSYLLNFIEIDKAVSRQIK